MHKIRCGECTSVTMTVKIHENLVTVFCHNCRKIVRQWTIDQEKNAWKIDRVIQQCRIVGIEPEIKEDDDPGFKGVVVQITYGKGEYENG